MAALKYGVNIQVNKPFRSHSFMDRRSLIKNTGIAGVLAAGIAPAVHAQEVIR